MWWYFVPGLVVFLLLFWFLFGGGIYRKVFAEAHFREVADKLPALKQAALEQPIMSEADVPQPPTDPRVLLTSVGLALMYTVTPDEQRYRHHLSISLPARGHTAHAVGDLFTWFLAGLLGVEMKQLFLGIAPSTVHHAVFTLNRDEHEAYAQRPVASFSLEDLKALRQEWSRSYHTVRWERLPV